MRNALLIGLLISTALPYAVASKDRKGPANPPPCSAEMTQAIDAVQSGLSRAGITPPVPVFQPEAEFTDAARKQMRKKHQPLADTILGLTVDTSGNPQNVCLIQAAGMGLDASAATVVKRYTFKPAIRNGQPVEYPTSVQVSFRLF